MRMTFSHDTKKPMCSNSTAALLQVVDTQLLVPGCLHSADPDRDGSKGDISENGQLIST